MYGKFVDSLCVAAQIGGTAGIPSTLHAQQTKNPALAVVIYKRVVGLPAVRMISLKFIGSPIGHRVAVIKHKLVCVPQIRLRTKLMVA